MISVPLVVARDTRCGQRRATACSRMTTQSPIIKTIGGPSSGSTNSLAARDWNSWLYSTAGTHSGASPVSKPTVAHGRGERPDWILEIWHALNGWYGEFELRCRRTCVSGSCVDATICAAVASGWIVRCAVVRARRSEGPQSAQVPNAALKPDGCFGLILLKNSKNRISKNSARSTPLRILNEDCRERFLRA